MLRKKKQPVPVEQQPAVTFVICSKGFFYSIGNKLIPAGKFEKQFALPDWMIEPDPQFLN